jgi:hypothetical protein
MFRFVCIIRRTWRRVTHFPKSLNELVSRFIRRQLQKCGLFLIADDVRYISREPFAVTLGQELHAVFGGAKA